LTFHLPLVLSGFTQLDWKPLLASYLGLFLMGGVFLSLGLFASSLTENQFVAAVISLTVVGAIVGVPLAILGFLLTLRGLF
jgi:ABC-2 type transport system permease protein